MTETLDHDTHNRLYDELKEISKTLSEIKVAIALLQQTQVSVERDRSAANSKIAVLEERVNKIELFRARLRVYGALGAIVVYLVLDLIKSYASRFFNS